jgi:hypothetical protein
VGGQYGDPDTAISSPKGVQIAALRAKQKHDLMAVAVSAEQLSRGRVNASSIPEMVSGQTIVGGSM